MKKSNSRFKGTVRPIICSVVSALALIGDSAYAQFAQIPLHLQNKTVTTAGEGVKPNVMLFIDDSGSMKDTPSGKKLGNNSSDYYDYNYYNDDYYNRYVRDYYDDDDKYYSRYGSAYYDPYYGTYSSGGPSYYSSSRRSSSQRRSRSTVDRNFANQRDDNESKLDITKKALFAILKHYNNKINWGLQTLHNNGKSDLDGYSDNWKNVQEQVRLIKADSGTPTTRRYHEISKIVKDNTLYRCQKNYIVLMSDGDANTSCGYEGNAKNPPFNYSGDAYFGFPKDFSNGCNRQKDNDRYHTFWDQNDGLRFFSQTFATKDFKTGGFDRTGKSWDGADIDFKDKKTGKSIYADQIAETFTVGFGTDISQRGETYLKRGASKPEYYHNAKNTNDLINAFTRIFENIEAESLNHPIEIEGSVAPAVTGNKVPNLAAIVQLDTGSWSSQLQFFDVNSDGKINATLKPKYPSFADRKTLINTGDGIHWAKDLQKDNAYFGIERGNAIDDKEWKEALVPWVARLEADETIKTHAQNKKYSQTYRVRAQGQELGDILDSPVAAIGKERYGRQALLVTAANDGMAHIFVSQDDKEHPYKLELSYIPAAMEQDGTNTLAKGLKYLANEKYGQTVPHRHMINGGFVLRRTASHNSADEKQQIFMFGSMGQGGRGAYALNIGGINRITGKPTGVRSTDPKADVPLFETAKGSENKLGYTVGSPQIGRVSIQRNANAAAVDISKNIRYAGFLASGYSSSKWKKVGNPKPDENKQETALYVYDILGQEANVGTKTGNPGTLLRKISVAEGVGGLSSPTLVDVNFDGVIDIAYAGDYGGNMYRFDFRKENPEQWSYQRIYQGNDKQPITSAPAVSRRGTEKYVVIFGTGSDIYQEDLEDKNQQAVYGIFDDVSSTKANSTAVAATSNDLQVQTISSRIIDGQEYRFLSNNAIGSNHKGWKVNLASNGERVVIKPTMILRTAVVSTRIYDAAKTDNVEGDVCVKQSSNKISSSSWVFGLNAETGGALRKSDAHLVFKNNPRNGEFYANGRKSSGLLNFTYVDTAKGDDNPVTVDGDSGGTGTDRMITTMPFIPQNKCFVDKASRTLITNKKESIGVEGRICGLRRISWREIFN
ncbi:PilC family type IV pilus tip adhesin [Neisseria sp. MVDL18-041461]|uniref:PilC family type IV pilus tip adhesin n=1 Tax=Neisseria sp. MVDL18-041461 TaxID=3061168 RepID=UPI00265EA306|nr:PilC family type IV pilus tip adhesin [Neisseria sp. MVDL18-041461]MDO1515854.1 PilC family type IV pilus tip adhesin [Neisseria sp. MVDL18-041461]